MILSVLSGKGGTGKTTVAVNLAISLAAKGERALIVDADVEEPNVGLYLKPEIKETISVSVPVPEIDSSLCKLCGECAKFCQFNALAVVTGRVLIFPELCHGCGGCLLVCPVQAIREVFREMGTVEKGQAGFLEVWQGRLNTGEPFAVPVTRMLKKELSGLTDKDVIIIDAPPGASCPVIEAVRQSDFAILVTEPTPFGRHDLNVALELVRQLEIPCGVIINRSGESDTLIEDFCQEEGVPVLMKIPFSTQLASLGARGIPFSRVLPYWGDRFYKLFCGIKESYLCASS